MSEEEISSYEEDFDEVVASQTNLAGTRYLQIITTIYLLSQN